MFHVKQSPSSPHEPERRPRSSARHRGAVVLALALVVALALGCAATQSPKGWAAPTGQGAVIVVQLEPGQIGGLRVTSDPVERLWAYPGDDSDIDLEAIYATPIIDGNTVYVAAYSGLVVALDLSTGTTIDSWREPTDVGSRIIATPQFDGSRLYVATNDGKVHVLDATSGLITSTLLEVDGRLWGRPALAAGTLYVGALDSRIRAVGTADGALRWERDVAGAIASDLTLDRELLIVGSFDHGLQAFDIDSAGAERWTFTAQSWFWARPLVVGEVVYAATVGGDVYALDRDTGTRRWVFRQDHGEIRAAPILSGGTLVIATKDGYLYGLNPTNGRELWSQRVDDAHFFADPLLIDTGVVYSSDSGALIRVTPDSGTVVPLFEQG